MTALAQGGAEERGSNVVPQAGLSRLFAEALARKPGALALLDQEGREAWSGRPRIAWSLRAAEPMVERLAGFFDALDLPRGACVAVMLPGGAEICLTLIALERAGLVPALIPVAGEPEETARAIEAVQAVALVTQATIGDLRPAERARDLAMAYFGLRFVLAFGPNVPDGVLELDRVLVENARVRVRVSDAEEGASHSAQAQDEAREPGIVTLARDPAGPRAIFRPAASWLAATADYLAVARIAPGERIVGLLAPDDLAGLVTGPFAAFAAGAAYEAHGLFDGPALAASLARGGPARLVAPGWMEDALAAARLPPCVTGLVLVHQAPVRFKRRQDVGRPVIDVLALGEWALVAAARREPGRIALTLDRPREKNGALLALHCGEDGRITAEGAASRARPLERSLGAQTCPDRRDTGFVAERFAGYVIGVG